MTAGTPGRCGTTLPRRLAGWAFGTRGGGYATPDASPSVTTAAPHGEPAAAPAPAPEPPDTTQPAPRPRIAGFGSEPVLPKDGTFWKLSPGPGLVTFVLDAQHATTVELWLTPTGTGVSDLSRKIGQDSNGRDGWCSTGTTRTSRSWAT